VVVVSFILTVRTPEASAQSQASESDNHAGLLNKAQMQVLTGKVSIEGGSSDVPINTEVVLECGETERARVKTDLDGNFAFHTNHPEPSYASTSQLSARGTPTTETFCELYADAPGYTSERLHLSPGESEVAQVGTIMLHPMEARLSYESATVSIATLKAPDKAKKAFDKGQQQAKKRNWQSACDYFRRAIEMYPRFALAWLELGRAQLQQHDLDVAQQSFQRAIAEDAHLISGYLELTDLAAKQREWSLVAGTTDNLAQMAPDLSPKVWFFNSVAKFNLGDMPNAERSVKRGLTLDRRHEVPQLEYVYGMVLARQHNYVQAVEHIRTYIRMAPHDEDVENANSMLSTIEQLASQVPQESNR
jgi:predicted Zn-dependent protease